MKACTASVVATVGLVAIIGLPFASAVVAQPSDGGGAV